MVRGEPSALRPTFDAVDAARPHERIGLYKVAGGFNQPTDLQFVPGSRDLFVVLEKEGTAKWVDLSGPVRSGALLQVDVLTESEEGLLGLAFHPQFARNGRFFLDYVAARPSGDTTVVEEWSVPPGSDLRTAKPVPVRVVLEVHQPYANHNGGQLVFGPDGMLYIALGDGGFRHDPHGHGQNGASLLGKILRLDVDHAPPGAGYAIPKDNPFVARDGFRPEIFALGLRNPWRFSFTPRGQLVAADVGQDTWEELDVLPSGANAGWRVREGRHCHIPEEGCTTEGLTDPVFEYDHHQGQSITGGDVMTGRLLPALSGKYVFGDFVAGRLWAVDIPKHPNPDGPLLVPTALGKWQLLPTTFGRDADGELYVADFLTGSVFLLGPPSMTTDAAANPQTPAGSPRDQ